MDASPALVNHCNLTDGAGWFTSRTLSQSLDTRSWITLTLNTATKVDVSDTNPSATLPDLCLTEVTDLYPSSNTMLHGPTPVFPNLPHQVNLPLKAKTLNITDNTEKGTSSAFAACGFTATNTVVQPSCTVPFGAIDVTVTGAGFPIDYLWSNGATTQDISGLGTGSYSLTLTDTFGCIDSLTQDINPAILLSEINLVAAVNCPGGSDGILSVSTSGGTPPYNYIWNTGGMTSAISNLPAGIYIVTVSDQVGCLTYTQYDIPEILPLVSGFIFSSQPTCFEGNDGIAVVNVNGGTLPYTYLWSNGATIVNPANLEGPSGPSNGFYQITVTDFQGCTATNEIFIDEPTQVGVSTSLLVPVDCNGAATGAAAASASGGIPPYNYVWSNGQSTQFIQNLTVGIYTVTASDSNSCTSTLSFSITEPTTLNVPNVQTEIVTCFGGNDGTASVTPVGGVLPYAYEWSNGDTNAMATGLVAGNYSVTVTDANNCTRMNSALLLQPTQLLAAISLDLPITCAGRSDGVVTISASQGTPPYNFLWNNGETTATISNLPAGLMSATVTDDSGCTAIANYDIPQILPLTSGFIFSSEPTCFGFNDGVAVVNVNGGTLPYSYLWSNGATIENPNNLQGPSGPTAGFYEITVTDFRGCVHSNQIFIDEPTAVGASIVIDTPVDCNGNNNAVATVSPSGGIPPYTFLWNTGQTTATETGLVAGSYNVTVQDDNGCTFVEPLTLTEPTLLSALPTQQTNTQCSAFNDGTGTVSANGGTLPYSYLWSNGATTALATGLGAGPYTATITDANSCSVTSGLTITQPSNLNIFISLDLPITCAGRSDGVVSANASGGVSPYTYIWSTGETAVTISNLPAGLVSVTVTDDQACSIADTYDIPQILPLVSGFIFTAEPTCFGFSDGVAVVNVNGGTLPYSYLWSNGATVENPNNLAGPSGPTAGFYEITVTDFRGCVHTNQVFIDEPAAVGASISIDSPVDCNGNNNGVATVLPSGGIAPYTFLWNTGQTAATENGLGAGSYSVTVQDDNGCTFVEPFTLTEPTLLTALPTQQTNALCFSSSDGTGTVAANGGTLPYSYSWSNGATNALATGLAAGIYAATITDANSCSVTAGLTITQPSDLGIFISLDLPITCAGRSDGVVTANASGGVSPYSYIWSNGETTETISNLPAGLISVTLTDIQGCSISDTYDIPQILPLVSGFIFTSEPTCFGFNDGVAIVNVNGGTLPYSYLWSNGATVENPNNLEGPSGPTAGFYDITVTDFRGCVHTNQVFIDEPAAVDASVSVDTPVDCNGNNNGVATVLPSGGLPPYTYLWSTGQTAATENGLGAGPYSITVQDDNGCTFVEPFTLTEPTLLTALPTQQTNALCFSSSDGTGTVAASGGTLPYSYNWSNGATDALATGLAAGVYNATITDANLCSVTSSLTITQPSNLGVFISLDAPITCAGRSDGVITANASGGVSPYSYIWTNGETLATISNLPAGIITVTVTDIQGCSISDTYDIPQILPLVSGFISITEPTCFGFNDGIAVVNVNGGTLPYSYLWSNGATTVNPSNLQGPSGPTAGFYEITVTDFRGCVHTNQVFIDEPAILNASINIDTPIDCQGNNNGEASVLASGGIPPYSYIWDNGQTTMTATGLTMGSYSVTIFDDNACSFTSGVSLTEPDLLLASLTIVDAPCQTNGGSITVSASDGTSPYQYSIDAGMNFQTSPIFNNLLQGPYTILTEDANGCQVNNTGSILGIAGPTILSLDLQTNAHCGMSSGSFIVQTTAGTPPLSYILDSTLTQTVPNFNNLPSGTYHVEVLDMFGCSSTAAITLPEIPGPVIDSIVEIDPICNLDNGSLEVFVSFGTGPLSFTIDGFTNTQSSNLFSGLSAGTYTVEVRDTTGCEASSTLSIVNHPPPVIFFLGVTPTYCDMAIGEITIFSNGGTPPLQYSIDGTTFQSTNLFTNLAEGPYIPTVVDANGCTSTRNALIQNLPGPTATVQSQTEPACGMATGTVTFQSTGGIGPYEYSLENDPFIPSNTFTGLADGVYEVIVRDINNCQDTLSFTMTDILPPTIAMVQTQEPTCGNPNGELTITANGVTPPFTYSIDNGANFVGTNLFTGLFAGTYDLVVQDANGCMASGQATLTDPGLPDVAGVVITPSTCGFSNGSLTILASGGTSPWEYSIDGGVNFLQNNTFTNLGAGSYPVIVRDSNACLADSLVILNNIPGPTIDSITGSPPACSQFTGSLTVYLNAGTGPFTYSIDGGTNTQPSSTFNNLNAGNYTVLATDSNGCTVTGAIQLIDQPSPIVSGMVSQNTYCDSTGGSLQVEAMSGVPPYTYQWNTVPTQNTDLAIDLAPGIYTVTVSDSNNCTVTASGLVEYPIPPYVDLGNDFFSCGLQPFTLDAGNVGAEFVWSNGATTQTIEAANYGSYIVTVTDNNLCAVADTIVITEDLFFPTITSDTVIVKGQSGELFATGGINYTWSPQTGLSCWTCPDPMITPDQTTVYSVEISNSTGCTDTLQVLVTVVNSLFELIDISTAFSPNEDGINDNWEVPFIEYFPENQLTIVNRWGDVVYRAAPYMNEWGGTYKGRPLPQGTYYYLLELDVNQYTTLKGPITILK